MTQIITMVQSLTQSRTAWSVKSSITRDKANGGDQFPAERVQILNEDAVKVLHSICQQIWKTQQWPQDLKRSVFIPVPRRTMPKNVQTTAQLHSFHLLVRQWSKSFKFQKYKLSLEKAEEPEIKLPTFVGSQKKQGNFRKTSTSASLTTTKVFDCMDHNRLWKILKEMGIPDHLTCLLQNLYAGQVATEPDMEQWIGPKLGKEYIKAVYCQPVYLLYRQICCYSVTKLCLTLCNPMNCSM